MADAGAAVVVALDTTAVAAAGFAASSFAYPVTATANTRTAMIAEIFFIFIHPRSFPWI
jgi:hypothetical protein